MDRQKAAEWVIDGKCQAWKYDYSDIFNILRKGTEEARATAAQTMDEVRKAMRIDYFNDTTPGTIVAPAR